MYALIAHSHTAAPEQKSAGIPLFIEIYENISKTNGGISDALE